MKASVINLTPELAHELLKLNTGNRQIDKNRVLFYANQMKHGQWNEDGSSITVDANKVLTNGQHRLMAVIKANYSYEAVLVEDVAPESFATMDTAKTRGAHDALYIAGFTKYTAFCSSVIKRILYYNNSQKYSVMGSGISTTNKHASTMEDYYVTNASVLKFMEENHEYMYHLASKVGYLKRLQTVLRFSPTELGFYMYLFGGQNIEHDDLTDFMHKLVGVNVEPGTAIWSLHTNIDKAARHNVSLSSTKKFGLVVKAWNDFILDGGLTRVQFNPKKEKMPTPVQLVDEI